MLSERPRSLSGNGHDASWHRQAKGPEVRQALLHADERRTWAVASDPRVFGIGGLEGFDGRVGQGTPGPSILDALRQLNVRISGLATVVHTEHAVLTPGRVTGPVKMLIAVAERWRIGDAELAMLLGLEHAAQVKALRSGATTLRGRDREDRARYLISMYDALFQTLRDQEAEAQWLRVPRAELEGRSPLDQMLEGSMASLLLAYDFIERWAGR
jgi:Protein of unknown function (DUF2384)